MKYQRLATIALCTMIAVRGAAGEGTQPTEPAEVGMPPTRVRLTLTDASRLKAELVRVEEERFIVRTMARIPEERSIALTEVKRAEVSRGSHGHALKGFLWGGGIGFVTGFAWGGSSDCGCSASTKDRFEVGGLFGSLLGGLGAGIGALIRTERWSEVPVSSLPAASPDRELRFHIGPTLDRGVQAQFSIGWR